MPDPHKTETPPVSRRGFFFQWGLISVFWLLITLASLLEASWFSPAGATFWWPLVAWQWLPWILLTPVIMWLASVFTIERSTWHRTIWVHLAACVAIAGGLGTLSYLESVRPLMGAQTPYFGQQFPMGPRGPRPEGSQMPDGSNFPGGRQPGWGPGPGTNWTGPGQHGDMPPRGGGEGWSGPRREAGEFGMPPGTAFNMPFRWGPPVAQVIMASATFQLPTFWAVLGMAHALLFYRRAKDRERRGAELESRLTQARLQALRMQLNPHFLFNTLNSISSLVYDQPRAADEMIGSLSDLLRLTLNTPDRQEVTLREELSFLDEYLFIEQTRFGSRLKVEKNIEPAALDAVTPILILQPLVENAFKHGIEATLGPGVIGISAKRVGDTLHLEVTDNGRGPTAAPDSKLTEGVGLGNTRARLRELYGERGTLDYGARREGGFWVAAHLPWRTGPLEKAGAKTEPKA